MVEGTMERFEKLHKIEKEVNHKAIGKTTNDTRHYILNITEYANQLNTMVRAHWSVENKMHWVLDVVFQADYARRRAGESTENFNLIFKMALLLINNEKNFKKSKNNKRLRAMPDRKYRENIIFLNTFTLGSML